MCEDQILNYTCHCFKGFTGRHCEIDIDECSSSPCQNGGTCFEKSHQHLINNFSESLIRDQYFNFSQIAGYLCQCSSGFEGINCEFNINDCENNLCMNNATCIDAINSYSCQCINGFDGKTSLDFD
jgi:hypothetical protein